jgi:hypothetical protein
MRCHDAALVWNCLDIPIVRRQPCRGLLMSGCVIETVSCRHSQGCIGTTWHKFECRLDNSTAKHFEVSNLLRFNRNVVSVCVKVCVSVYAYIIRLDSLTRAMCLLCSRITVIQVP